MSETTEKTGNSEMKDKAADPNGPQSAARTRSHSSRSSETTISTSSSAAAPSSPITRSGRRPRPMPIGSTRLAPWPATCSTDSTTSSARPRRCGPRPRRGSPRGSRWSTNNCWRRSRNMASSRSTRSASPSIRTSTRRVVQQPDDDHPEGTVVAELSKGYKIHDRVLRPTKVAVSIAPTEATPATVRSS